MSECNTPARAYEKLFRGATGSEEISDEALREKMSQQARECARQYVIETGWTRWRDAYRGLFKSG